MTDHLSCNEPIDSDRGTLLPRLLGTPLLLVVAGGSAGTTLRVLLSAAVPDIDGVPWGIFVINLIGGFALGLLLEILARRGPDTGRRRQFRLLLGTGLIGGFTTYSALSVDTAMLLDDSQLPAGAGYALATVLLGAIASVLGILTGRLVPAQRARS